MKIANRQRFDRVISTHPSPDVVRHEQKINIKKKVKA